MALCDLHDTFQFLLYLDVVPDECGQKIIGGVEGAHGEDVGGGQIGHDLDEIDDQQVVVLRLDQVLVKDQVLVLLGDDQVGPVLGSIALGF